MHDRDELSFSELAFLAAKTGWDPSSDWDTRLQSSAACCTSLADASRLGSFDPEIGLQIIEICDLLKKVFTSQDKYVKFLKYSGSAAQDILDVLQKLLDHATLERQFRSLLYVALVRLCRKSELCPQSFILEGVTNKEKDSLMAGSFGDVYKARYNGNRVCVKCVKVYRERDSEESFTRRKGLARKAFSREAVVWGQLSDANILPFYGICFLKEKLYLVSPLVPNGDVNDYLEDRPEANRSHLIYGVASGMEYLHRNGVAHGDLKCANVLVAEPEQALLTDFGFSYVTDKHGLNHWKLSSDHARGGTWVFEAPERVADRSRRRDGASDVFAFGMLCYEMVTFPPLEGTTDIRAVHDNIIHHSKLPEQPERYLSRGLTENMWALIIKCWSRRPSDRPNANEIKHKLSSSSRGEQFHFRRMIRPGFQSVDAAVTRALYYLNAV